MSDAIVNALNENTAVLRQILAVLASQQAAANENGLAPGEELTTADCYMVRDKTDGEPMLMFYVKDHPRRTICVGKLYFEKFGLLPFAPDMSKKHWKSKATPERDDIPDGHLIDMPHMLAYVRSTREAKEGQGMDSKPIVRILHWLDEADEPIPFTPIGKQLTTPPTTMEAAVAVAGTALANYRSVITQVVDFAAETTMAMDMIASGWSDKQHRKDNTIPVVQAANELEDKHLETLAKAVRENITGYKKYWASIKPKAPKGNGK